MFFISASTLKISSSFNLSLDSVDLKYILTRSSAKNKHSSEQLKHEIHKNMRIEILTYGYM